MDGFLSGFLSGFLREIFPVPSRSATSYVIRSVPDASGFPPAHRRLSGKAREQRSFVRGLCLKEVLAAVFPVHDLDVGPPLLGQTLGQLHDLQRLGRRALV